MSGGNDISLIYPWLHISARLTRTNWPRKVRELIFRFTVPGGQRGKMLHRIGSNIWWVLWWFVMQTRWSWVCMRPRDLFRGPRGFMGGPGGASGSRRASRGSHGAIREVRRVFWWFMRHVCLYILWSRFFLHTGVHSTRGSTRGPRGPNKKITVIKVMCNRMHSARWMQGGWLCWRSWLILKPINSCFGQYCESSSLSQWRSQKCFGRALSFASFDVCLTLKSLFIIHLLFIFASITIQQT